MRTTIKARLRKLEAAEQTTGGQTVAEILDQGRKEWAQVVGGDYCLWWSPVETAGTTRAAASRPPWVPLPTPGGPKRTTRSMSLLLR